MVYLAVSLPLPDALPGLLWGFMEVAASRRLMKFAPSFTLTLPITLFNVPYINPHMRQSFRILFQEKTNKKTPTPFVSYEEIMAKLLSDPRNYLSNYLRFICLRFIDRVLKYCFNLFNFQVNILYIVSNYFWERVEVNRLNY